MANTRRRLTGEVVSNKMDKTVVVEVRRAYRHPLYGKTVYKYSKFMAHDEGNVCEMGDEVVIVESRPLSKHKRWVVQEILREDASARTAAVEEVASVPAVEPAASADEAEDMDEAEFEDEELEDA